MTKDKVEPPNGKGHAQLEIIPAVMDVENRGADVMNIAKQIKNEFNATRQQTDMSKYIVMDGMQNPDKRQFFTEYKDFDDVLRMNTIERYIAVAPLIIRKTSPKSLEKIRLLMQTVYGEHVEEHKENMTSKQRKREEAYVRILGADSSDSGVAPTGFKKFFGIGGKK